LNQYCWSTPPKSLFRQYRAMSGHSEINAQGQQETSPPSARTATDVVLIQELPAGRAALFAGRFPRPPGDDAARRADHISGIE
jgi:hypothetical protein